MLSTRPPINEALQLTGMFRHCKAVMSVSTVTGSGGLGMSLKPHATDLGLECRCCETVTEDRLMVFILLLSLPVDQMRGMVPLLRIGARGTGLSSYN